MNRLITALGLIALAAYLVGWAPTPIFLAGALAFRLLCYWEYSGLVVAQAIPRPGTAWLAHGPADYFLSSVHFARCEHLADWVFYRRVAYGQSARCACRR